MDPLFADLSYRLNLVDADAARVWVSRPGDETPPTAIELDPADGPVIFAAAHGEARGTLVQRNGRVTGYDLRRHETLFQARPLAVEAVRAAMTFTGGTLVLAGHQNGRTQLETLMLDSGKPLGSYQLPRDCFRGHLQLCGVDTFMLYNQGRDDQGRWFHGYHRLEPVMREQDYRPLPAPPQRHFAGRPPLLHPDFHLGCHLVWQPPRQDADGYWYELNLFDLNQLNSWRYLPARCFADPGDSPAEFFDRLRLLAGGYDRPWIWCLWRDGALTRPGLYGAASPMIGIEPPPGIDPARLLPTYEDDDGLYLQDGPGGRFFRLPLAGLDWQAFDSAPRLPLEAVSEPPVTANPLWCN